MGMVYPSSTFKLDLFTCPCISFYSCCPRHLIIVELEKMELEVHLLSFICICEFEVRSQP